MSVGEKWLQLEQEVDGMEALLRMGVNSRRPEGSVLGIGKQWKGDIRHDVGVPVTNRDEEHTEVSPAGLQANDVGEAVRVVRDGGPGLSVLTTLEGGKARWRTWSCCESLDHSVDGRTHGTGGIIPRARDSISTPGRGRAVLL